ncbi:inositol monophosphatase family protein [Ignicoccus hospitalis]|uniref:Inositol monophosphatase n=1 Tax=Ignicoccus hospitalis (strain KIN4/I / DSM 18386 / JCM 14125) TaxID=453591 RepID=A8A9C4_IGNH4|nr:inositol monophosphatase family protein [Ignicoccus hospitalis]ABU81526.1 inositol monophosphatase [Ignicoccus hospitalis KIN4/I]HIH90461.1 hypothetical protein [Desulfurococcaceae archaeon]
MEGPRKLALKVAERARDFLRSKFLDESYLKVVEEHKSDVSRKIDLEVEDLIIKTLREEGFKGGIVTEEKGVVGEGPPYAVVDPLDGSLNYAVGSPHWAVSVAIAEGEDFSTLVASAVCPGFGHPCYSASDKAYSGEGEVIPGAPEKVLVFYGEPEDERQSKYLVELRKLLGRPKVRVPGAIALDMVNVARGKLLALVDVRNKIRNVDVAGAYLIIKRAGVPVPEVYESFPTDEVSVVGNLFFGRDERVLSALLSSASKLGLWQGDPDNVQARAGRFLP